MTDTIPCPPPFETVEHGSVVDVELVDEYAIVSLMIPRAAGLPALQDECELRWLSRAEAAE